MACQILQATMIGGVCVIVMAHHMRCPLLQCGSHVSTCDTEQRLHSHV